MKRNRLPATAAAMSLLSAAVAQVSYAQLNNAPVYDPFAYPSGQLAGQGGWSQLAGVNGINVDSAKNNSYTGLNPSAPGAVQVDVGGISAGTTPGTAGAKWGIAGAAADSGATFYYSFTLKV